MNPRFLATWMSKFCTLAPNIFGIIISIFFLYVQKCVSFIAPIRHCQVMVRFTGHSRIVNLQHLVMSPFLYLIFEGECLIFGKLVGPWHTGSDVRRVSVSSAWVWQLKKVENTGLVFPLVCFDVEWLVNDVSRFLSPSTKSCLEDMWDMTSLFLWDKMQKKNHVMDCPILIVPVSICVVQSIQTM